jgi:hypothetical protein
MFMLVIVPTYNAVWLDVRRCVECGVGFDLHSAAEVSTVRQCPQCAGSPNCTVIGWRHDAIRSPSSSATNRPQ